jgi:hypothetical protein
VKAPILGMRAGFGAGLVANGINHFAIPLFAAPAGSAPLARQLLGALTHIGLLDVAMAIVLVAGTLLLVGIAVPAALCATMPITTCAAYWAVMLERDPSWAFVALVMLALNGLLLLAYRDTFRGVLEPHPAAIGETREGAA